MESLNKLLLNAKIASKEIVKLSNKEVNEIIYKISDNLINNLEYIISENKKDLENGVKSGLSNAMIDRLMIDEKRLTAIANDMKKVADLPDVIDDIIEEYNRPNGLNIKKVRVPFGVICAIFESRPNVSVDIACLALKTKNAVVLRGGKEAINTNKALAKVMREAISGYTDENVVSLIENTDRALVLEILQSKDYIDLVVPRGSKGLIQHVISNAKIPYVETGAGNCHLYVSKEADLDDALRIALNAKVQRPAVCNAIESLLVDEEVAEEFLVRLKAEFDKYNVEIRGCEKTRKYIDAIEATEEDFYEEYDNYIISVKVINGVDEAISHINKYSTKHSEAIITKNMVDAEKFLNEVDSACVYVNASTRFTDGGEFGFGAELGISTQKLHARGPMGLKELTTYKYKIYGNGQIR